MLDGSVDWTNCELKIYEVSIVPLTDDEATRLSVRKEIRKRQNELKGEKTC